MKIEFNKFPQIFSGISERNDGSMVWWNRIPVNEEIQKNRDKYFNNLGIDPGRVVAGGIAHSTNVALVGEKEAGQYLLDTDALITKTSDLYLTITTADCLPILCYDPMNQCIGIIHAGWRGLVGGIIENTIKKFTLSFHSDPKNLQIIIGPHIKNCHYEVGTEVARQFNKKNIKNHDGRLYADLSGEAEIRFRESGVPGISISPICTYENTDKFYSARHDKTDPIEGMVAYIGIKKYEKDNF